MPPRKSLVVLLLILAACSSPSTAPELVAALQDGGVDCVRVDEPSDTLALCDTGEGIVTITVHENPDSQAPFVALGMDDGRSGPWVLGDGWTATAEGEMLATLVQDVLGGDVIRTIEDLLDR